MKAEWDLEVEGFCAPLFLGKVESGRAPGSGSERGQTARRSECVGGSSAPVPVVPRSDPLRPASLYKAAARDVLPAL